MTKIFIAAPISGFVKKAEYMIFREFILHLIFVLRQEKFDVCSEVEHISKTDNYDNPTKSVNDDFSNIQSSDIFLLLHPKKMQTSSLIELGFACSENKKIVLVGKKEDFPYLANGLVESEIMTKFVEVINFTDRAIEMIVDALKSITYD